MSPHGSQPETPSVIRVLHIDDDPDVLAITRESLESFDPGILLQACTDPEKGLKEIEATDYDCIVSDYQMGEYDSLGLAEIIHERFDLPVLIYTGRGSEEVAEAAIEAGFDDYIRKEASPSHYQVLGKRIRVAVEKHRSERALRESEERFRSLFESTHDGVVVAGPDGRYISANSAAAKILGYDAPEELQGLKAEDFYKNPLERRDLFEKLNETGYVTDFRHEIRRRDGSLGYLSSNVTLIRAEDRTVLRSEGFFRDITERKRMEEALRISQERLYAFMESAPVNLAIYDSDLNYLEVNQNLLDLYGNTRESLIGRNVGDIHPDTVETGRAKLYREVIRTGEPLFLPEVKAPQQLGDRIFSIWAFNVGEGMGLISTDISEYKKMEQRLRASETLYRELAERSIDVIYIVDLEGRLQYLSPSVETLTGHKPEELIGKPYLGFLSVDHQQGVETALGNAIKGNQIQGFQTEIVGKDGRKVSVEVNSSLILEEGSPTGFQGVIRDITERKRMEDELRESEEKYRNLVELCPSGIITFDFKGYVTSVNSAIERLTGFTPDEIVGRHFTKLGYFRVQDIPRYVRLFATLMRGNLPPSTVFPYQHKDGTLKWAEGYGGYAYEKGERVGFQGIVIDITERRRLGDRLAALHEHAVELGEADSLKAIAETTLNVLDLTLGFEIGTFCVNTGSTLEMRYGRGVEPWEPFELPFNGKGVTVRAAKTRRTQLVNDSRLDSDYVSGPERPLFEVRSEIDVPVLVDDEVVAIINANSTKPNAITEQDQKLIETLARHVSSAISRLRRVDSLEELVEKRSQELVEAEKMVTAGKIAAMVGHDLRGPLVNIQNALYLIERKPEYFSRLNENIRSSIDFALNMLEELRISTRIEDPDVEAVDLESLISRAVEDVQLPPTITVETNMKMEAGRVSLDPVQIRRVLGNLIRNAVEAMPQGGDLSIDASIRDDELVIGVADTGSGIPADLKPELFKAFTTTKAKGMGLGLTYCKRAVEAHGGTIAVESEEGKGTRVTISIPQG